MTSTDLPLTQAEFNRIKNFYRNYDSEKLIPLLKEMDEKSINVVQRAVKKISYILQNTAKTIPELMTEIIAEDEFQDVKSKWQEFTDSIEYTNSGYKYKDYILPVHMFEYNVFVDKHYIDEINNFEIIRNKNIIDVGAFIGDSAIILSPLTDKNVYSFEVDPQNFYYMQDTIKLNNLKNVIPVNIALGDEPGSVHINAKGSATTIADENCENKILYKQDSLDHFVKEHNNLSVGLIKVDIEGYEMNFLQGAINTIKEQKPVLLISIYHNWNDYSGIKLFIESLNLGYKFKIRASSIATCTSETLLICEVL